MPDWLDKFLDAWIPLFVAIDPIGLVPFFLGMTLGMDEQRPRIARQATWTAATVAIVFILLGRFIFRALAITDRDFQVAGGLILLGLAGRDLLGADQRAPIAHEESGIVPLGLPIIAGPAMLATLMILIDNPSVGPAYTFAALAINLLIVYLALKYSGYLARRVGMKGLRALSKIIALLLAAIAVSMIRRGWQ